MLAKACSLRGHRAGWRAGRGRGRYRPRAARLRHRRPARRRRERGQGARARGDQEQRRDLPHAAHHRQPRPGRSAQGRPRLRSAHRRGHPDGLRAGAALSAAGDDGAAGECLFLGELSLDGGLRHTHGILPMVALARDRGIEAVFVPAMDAAEAALVEDVTVYPVGILAQLVAHLRGDERIAPYRARRLAAGLAAMTPSTPSISPTCAGRSTSSARWRSRRSGGHNVLMVGPAGRGQDAAGAQRCPRSCRRSALDEALEVTKHLQRQRACSARTSR